MNENDPIAEPRAVVREAYTALIAAGQPDLAARLVAATAVITAGKGPAGDPHIRWDADGLTIEGIGEEDQP